MNFKIAINENELRFSKVSVAQVYVLWSWRNSNRDWHWHWHWPAITSECPGPASSQFAGHSISYHSLSIKLKYQKSLSFECYFEVYLLPDTSSIINLVSLYLWEFESWNTFFFLYFSRYKMCFASFWDNGISLFLYMIKNFFMLYKN